MSTPREHIIKSYDDELTRLTGEIVRMGELAVAQLEAAIDVVERRDERAAQRVVDNDDAIDALEQEISHDVVRLLALRAPIAGDLRNVFAALRIAADIERIGDYAANVAKRSIPLSMVAPITATGSLGHLAELAAPKSATCLPPIVTAMPKAPTRYGRTTRDLDEAYTALFRQLLTYMMEDPRNITPVHAPAVHGEEHRAYRRPCHQHRRERLVPGPRRAADGAAHEARPDLQPGFRYQALRNIPRPDGEDWSDGEPVCRFELVPRIRPAGSRLPPGEGITSRSRAVSFNPRIPITTSPTQASRNGVRRFAEQEDAEGHCANGADTGPHRVSRTQWQLLRRHTPAARCWRPWPRPCTTLGHEPGEAIGVFQANGPGDLEQTGQMKE